MSVLTEHEEISASYLSHDLQRSFPSILSTDSELSWLVDQAAGLLKPRPVSLDLQPQNQYELLKMSRADQEKTWHTLIDWCRLK